MKNIKKYNPNKEYPIGTIVNTKWGKAIVEKSDGRCGSHTCIFHSKGDMHYCGKCRMEDREDCEFVYFKPIEEKEIMKEKRNIEIDIDTARNWYLSKDSFKQELALKAFSKEELEKAELPTSWSEYSQKAEYKEIAKNCCKFSKQIKILNRLLALRDVYRQGWKPNRNKDMTIYSIYPTIEFTTLDKCIMGFSITDYSSNGYMFSFPTEELAEQFLENFREELEQLKELL